jgi:hypothetical protein
VAESKIKVEVEVEVSRMTGYSDERLSEVKITHSVPADLSIGDGVVAVIEAMEEATGQARSRAQVELEALGTLEAVRAESAESAE